jgi:ubiquinone/menaquinone biosynthesis C-methylase UbiE
MSDDALFSTNLSHYEKLYADPFEKHSFEVRSKTQIFKSLQSQQKEPLRGKKVLDIGFGSGDILLTLSRQGAECYGIEIVRSVIERLKRQHPALHIFEARAASLPLKSDFFDIIVCSHVLEHESNERASVQEMIRVLKPGGKIFLGVPAVAVGETELHACLYDQSAIQNLADTFRLEILRSHAYGSGPFQIVYQAISALAVRASTHNDTVEFNKQNMAKYGIIRKFYHALVVPVLLFLYRLDAILPLNKGRPIEIWVILLKKL